jgi:hypothetical protein
MSFENGALVELAAPSLKQLKCTGRELQLILKNFFEQGGRLLVVLGGIEIVQGVPRPFEWVL